MNKDQTSENHIRPIRVLHLIDRITGYGTTRQLWNIVNLTSSEEIKHFVISFSPDQGNWYFSGRLEEKGVYRPFPKTGLLKLGRRNWVWFLVRYLYALWHVFQCLVSFRPHIIHVHTSLSLIVAVPLKVVLRFPVVHDVALLFSQMAPSGKAWVPKFYSRFHSLIDCFIAGVTSREELLSVGVPPEKVLVNRGGVDFQELSQVRNNRESHQKAIREHLKLPVNGVIVLSIGRLEPTKGHMFALEALPSLIAQFPKLHWVVVGEGKQREELEERAITLKVSDHVHLLGHQDKPLPYYAAATVFLRTLQLEERNTTCFEAMAMGLPMVGFDLGFDEDLIRQVGHGVLVPSRCVESLCKGVGQILLLPDHGREMGSRGIEYIRKNYDLRQGIQDVTAVYGVLKRGQVVSREELQPREIKGGSIRGPMSDKGTN